MKELFKPLFTWFVSLFNFGIYKFDAMNEMDSLILALQRNGVEKQANKLAHLYQLVSYQQETLIMLETFKCLFMVISILFLFILNQYIICRFFAKAYAKLKYGYEKLNTFFRKAA